MPLENIQKWSGAAPGTAGEADMLKSMTGYGRGEGMVGTRHIVFEVKSVNHKFYHSYLLAVSSLVRQFGNGHFEMVLPDQRMVNLQGVINHQVPAVHADGVFQE